MIRQTFRARRTFDLTWWSALLLVCAIRQTMRAFDRLNEGGPA